MSRQHARLLLVGEKCTISDLGSRNGVQVNGQLIDGAQMLKDGDEVQIGAYTFNILAEAGVVIDPEEIDHATQLPPEKDYQVPLYRTCISCRGMLKQGEQRCPRCSTEQNQSFHTVQLWTDPMGRRSSYRAPVRLRGLYVSALMTIEGEVSDLSLGGAFFASQLLDEPGTACDLLVFPSPESEVVRFSAEVVRTSQGTMVGMGIRFVRMTTAAQSWLATAVKLPG